MTSLRRSRWIGALLMAAACNGLAASLPGGFPLLLGNVLPLTLLGRTSRPLMAASLLVSVLPVLALDWHWALFALLQLGLLAVVIDARRGAMQALAWVALLAVVAGFARPSDGLQPHDELWLSGLLSGLSSSLVIHVAASQLRKGWWRLLDKRQKTLSQQLSGGVFVLLVPLLCFGSLLLVQLSWRNDLRHQAQELDRGAGEVALTLQHFLQNHRKAIEVQAKGMSLGSALPLDSFAAEFPTFLTLLVTDEVGGLRDFHAPNAQGFTGSVADREYFRVPMQNGSSYVSQVFRGRGFGNDVLVAVSAPLVGDSGKPVGIVEGSLSLAAVADEADSIADRGQLEYVLADANDIVVASSSPDLPPLSPATQPWAVTGTKRAGVVINGSGTHFIESRRLPDIAWRVSVLRNVGYLMVDNNLAASAVSIASLLILLLIGRGVSNVVAPFAAPLQLMVERLREVDLSRTDILKPLRLPASNAEFGELEADFDAMLARLHQLHRDLQSSLAATERLNQELEQRVAARTEELQQAVDQAHRLAEAKSIFLANISHELRTPLTAILGYAEQALQADDTEVGWQDRVQTILRQGRHLLAVVNDVLDASRIDAGQMQVGVEDCSLLHLSEEVCALMRPKAQEKQVELSAEYRWPLPASVKGDAFRLRQVLINLMGNALKFTERGSVRIELSCSENHLQICIVDTGIGMTPSQVARLFRPFEQADVSTTRRFGGSGLGLFISRRLIEAMGGRIQVDSEPGRGSRFLILLPLPSTPEWLDAMPAMSLQTQGPIATPSLRGKVLVVDDVDDLRALVAIMVRATGVDVLTGSDGDQAVRLGLANQVDLILLDMHMPVMDGRQAVRRLRERGFAGAVVGLTADVLPEDVAAFMAAGCDAVLSKPVDREALYRELGRLLRPAPAPSEPDAARPAGIEQLNSALALIRQRFVSQLPTTADQLTQALANNDTQQLTAQIHRLKGNAGTFGFQAISSLAAEAELLLRRAELPPEEACCRLLAAIQAVAAEPLDVRASDGS